MNAERFRFGDWLVDPLSNSIEQFGTRRQMEPRAMDVLVVLCRAAGRVVSADDLLSQCWRTHVYGDNPVHKTLAQLRRLLGDAASAPVYIETLRKRGYRTLAPVSFAPDPVAACAPWTDSPFRGLYPFDEQHAPVFFGRDKATRQLLAAVDAQVEAGLALQLVLGPSGSGKTSLVRAGLFPRLAAPRRGGGCVLLSHTCCDLAELGAQSLYVVLAAALLDLHCGDTDLFPLESAQSLARRLEQEPAAVVLQMRQALAARGQDGAQAGSPPAFGLFIDRFEAVFAPGAMSAQQHGALLALLEQLARSAAMLVVIACRNDFYPHIARDALLMAGKPNGAHFDLAPPSSAEIAQIIRLPVAAAGLRFGVDPDTHARLDDVLCESAASSPDALPLLQYCLHELYRGRGEEGVLGFDAFRRIGGVEGAIAQRAEQVVARLTEVQKAALERVMSLVIVVANEDSVTSRRAPWSALRDDAERQVVDALVESRLFVSELIGDRPGFGIVHEAILRRWPRMRAWIDSHKGSLLERGRLAQLAGRWVREGRSHDLLLPRGRQLDAACALQDAGVFDLSADERDLIRVSVRRARTRERLRLLASATIVVLALLALSLGISESAARKLAEQRRIEAEGLVGYMLGEFADRLRPLGKLDLLDKVSSRALAYLDAAGDNGGGKVALIQRARALQVIAEVRRAQGDSQAALDALGAANRILQGLRVAAPADPEVLENLGGNAYWLGQLSKDRNDMAAAAAYWQTYLDSADQLYRLQPANVDWWLEQSYAHNNLGSLAATRGEAGEAARQFMESIALKRRALDARPGARKLMSELADSYSWLGSAREVLGELAQAERLYEQEIMMVARLRAAAPGEGLWVEHEARALQHRAAIRLAQGRDQEALEDYRQAAHTFAAVAAGDRNNLAWQGEQANLDLKIQSILARSGVGAGAGAAALMERSHARLAGLLRLDPKKLNWAHSEAAARARLGAALLRRGRLADAREQARTASGSFETLYESNAANRNLRLASANALLLRADIELAALQEEGARRLCEQARARLGQDGAASSDFRVLDPWVRVNVCLGNHAAAANAAARLRSIGYRDADYLRHIPTQLKGQS